MVSLIAVLLSPSGVAPTPASAQVTPEPIPADLDELLNLSNFTAAMERWWGDRWGGYRVIEEDGNEVVIVGLTDPTDADMDLLRSRATMDARDLQGRFRVEAVDLSASEIDAIQADTVAALQAAGVDDFVVAGDSFEGTVTATVDETQLSPGAEAAVEASLPEAVSVDPEELELGFAGDLSDCPSPPEVRAGDNGHKLFGAKTIYLPTVIPLDCEPEDFEELTLQRCEVAFTALDGSGFPMGLTAGHCGLPGAGKPIIDVGNTLSPAKLVSGGYVTSNKFPATDVLAFYDDGEFGGGTGSGDDNAIPEIADNSYGEGLWQLTQVTGVAGTSSSVDDELRFYGDAGIEEAVVVETGVIVSVEGQTVTTEMDCVDIAPDPGESGGPLLEDDSGVAVGIMSVPYEVGDATYGCYTPIDEALDALSSSHGDVDLALYDSPVSLTGTVIEGLLEPVAGAEVTLFRNGGGSVASVNTDSDGHFYFGPSSLDDFYYGGQGTNQGEFRLRVEDLVGDNLTEFYKDQSSGGDIIRLLGGGDRDLGYLHMAESAVDAPPIGLNLGTPGDSSDGDWFVGDPVHTASGSLVESAVDVVVGSNSWRRTYSSRNSNVGVLGRGWSTLLDVELYPSSQGAPDRGDVYLRNPSGRMTLFEYDGDTQTWSTRFPDDGTLIFADDAFSITFPNREVWSFTTDELLDRIIYPDDTETVVVRDAGVVTRVEFPDDGRALGLSYNGNGLLSEVDALVWETSAWVEEDPSRSVVYTYASSDTEFLETVSKPGGQGDRYRVDDLEYGFVGYVDHLVTGSTYETAVESVFDEDGRVLEQTLPLGETAEFDYNWTEYVWETSVTFNGTDTFVYGHDEDGRIDWIQDPQGYAVNRDYEGEQLSGFQNRVGSASFNLYDAEGRLWRRFSPDPATGAVPETLDDPSADQAGVFEEYTYVTCGTPTVCPADDRRIASYSRVVRVDTVSGDNVFETTTYEYWEGETPSTNQIPVEVIPPGETRGTQTTVVDGLVTETRVPLGTGTDYVVTEHYYGDDAPDAIDPCPPRVLCETILAPGEDEESRTVYEYDDAGRRSAVIEAYGETAGGGSPGATRTEFAYDAAGNLVTVTDPLAAVSPSDDHYPTRNGYNLAGQLMWTAGPANPDSDGPTATAPGTPDAYEPDVVYTYTAGGQVETETTLLGYDGEGDPLTTTTLSEYDTSGRMERQTSAHGTADAAAIEYEYGVMGRLDATTVAPGNGEEMVTRFEYDPAGRQVRRIQDNPSGPDLVSATGFDAAGRVLCEADPDDTKVFLDLYEEDDGLGQLDCDATGSTFTAKYTYDLAGRVTKIEEQPYEGSTTQEREDNSSITQYTYDGSGRLFQTKRENGVYGQSIYTNYTYRNDVVEERTYDDAGRRLTVVTPTPNAWQFTWSSGTKVTTTSAYDDAGRLASVTEDTGGLAATTTTAYDAHGWALSTTSPGGDVTTNTYDALGQVTEVSRPSGIDTDPTYQATTWTPDGLVESQTDWSDDPEAAPTVDYTYTANGWTDTVTDPLGTSIQYGYDLRGNRTERVSTQTGGAPSCGGGPSATCITETWEYNTADQLIAASRPELGDQSFDYDFAGRRIQAVQVIDTDLERRTISNYTGSLLTSVDYEEWDTSGTPTLDDDDTVSFTYDARGRRKTMTDVRATTMSGDYDDARAVTYTYDEANNLIQTSDAHTTTPKVTKWAWSIAGNPFRMIHPDGTQFKFTHDNRNRLTQTALNLWTVWVPMADYTYNADNELTEEMLADNELSFREYERGAAGNITRYVQDMDGSDIRETIVTWGYDGRVASECTDTTVSETCTGTASAYAYDEAGQLNGAGGASCAWDGENSEADNCTTTWTFDGHGNRLTETSGAATIDYDHNLADQLTDIDHPTTDDVTHTYTDDGARSVTTIDSETITYNYGPAGRIDTVADDIYNVDVELTWSGDGYMNTFKTIYGGGDDAARINWDPTMAVPQMLDVIIDGVAHRQNYGLKRINSYVDWYAYDWQDSAIESADYPNNPTSYTPWGESVGAGAGVYFGYRGEFTIGSLVHLRNRNYEPDTGTFLTQDPIDGFDGTTTVANAYHYVDNDPLNKVDPLGLAPDDLGLIADEFSPEDYNQFRDGRDDLIQLLRMSRDVVQGRRGDPPVDSTLHLAGLCGGFEVGLLIGMDGGACLVATGDEIGTAEFVAYGALVAGNFNVGTVVSNAKRIADLNGDGICLAASAIVPGLGFCWGLTTNLPAGALVGGEFDAEIPEDLSLIWSSNASVSVGVSSGSVVFGETITQSVGWKDVPERISEAFAEYWRGYGEAGESFLEATLGKAQEELWASIHG